MSTHDRPLRVVQWTTGNIARQAIKAVVERPDLELVGVFAFSTDKVGKDASELAGLAHPTGVTATDDVEALIALQPDCVLYMPLHPEVDHLVQLLQNGVNVLSTASFITGRGLAKRRANSCRVPPSPEGQACSGAVLLGFAEYITALVSAPCREVNYVKLLESFNIGMWAGERGTRISSGRGCETGSPGHGDDIVKATAPFGDAVQAMADLFGVDIDAIRCEVEFAHAQSDVDGIPNRAIRKGTVAGIDARWIGSIGGTDLIEANVRWTVADIDRDWDIAMAYSRSKSAATLRSTLA